MITFELISVEKPIIDEQLIILWLETLVSKEGKEIGELTFYFCDDPYMLDANKKHFKHDYYTDVITFDMSEGDILSADILISLNTVQSNSEKFEEHFINELHRVIAHSVLHLIGYNDKNEAEQNEMTKQEDRALNLLSNMKNKVE